VKRRLFLLVEDCVMRFFRLLSFLIPHRAIPPLGRVLGRVLCAAVPPVKRNMVRQIREAFPDMPEAEVERVFREASRNAGKTLLEQVMVQEKMVRDAYDRALDVPAADAVRMALTRRDRGLIVLSPHMNNWEQLMGLVAHHMLRVHGEREFNARYVPHVVMTRMPTPYVDRLATHLRHRILRCNFVYTKQARYHIERLLAEKRYVCFATDVDYGYRGVFVPFFGRCVAMGRGPATYALKYDVPVCFLVSYYDEAGGFHVHAEEVPCERTGDAERDVVRLSARIAAVVERWVRRHPEQWFGWVQRPWRTRPLEELEAGLAANPQDANLRVQVGRCHAAAGRTQEARQAFREALASDPGCFPAHLELGKLCTAEGEHRYAEAGEHLRRAVQAKPGSAEARKAMGLLCMRLGRPRDGLRWFNRTIRSRFDIPEAYWGKGRCLEAVGEFRKAARAYRKGLRVDPDHAPLHEALLDMERRRPTGAPLEEHRTALRRLSVPYGSGRDGPPASAEAGPGPRETDRPPPVLPAGPAGGAQGPGASPPPAPL